MALAARPARPADPGAESRRRQGDRTRRDLRRTGRRPGERSGACRSPRARCGACRRRDADPDTAGRAVRPDRASSRLSGAGRQGGHRLGRPQRRRHAQADSLLSGRLGRDARNRCRCGASLSAETSPDADLRPGAHLPDRFLLSGARPGKFPAGRNVPRPGRHRGPEPAERPDHLGRWHRCLRHLRHGLFPRSRRRRRDPRDHLRQSRAPAVRQADGSGGRHRRDRPRQPCRSPCRPRVDKLEDARLRRPRPYSDLSCKLRPDAPRPCVRLAARTGTCFSRRGSRAGRPRLCGRKAPPPRDHPCLLAVSLARSRRAAGERPLAIEARRAKDGRSRCSSATFAASPPYRRT
ncbi:hypothetical protein ACVMB3_006897 [Sinorhizobium meliloti]